MILRLVGLMIAGALAYVMLRGWPEVIPALPRAFVAILLVVIALVWWTTGRKPKDLPLVKAGRRPSWLDLGAIGLGLLAFECGFLWLLSAAPEPLEDIAIKFEQQFRPEAAKIRDAKADGETGGNWLWDDQRQRSLPLRTNLKPGMKPEVFVRLFNEKDAERLLKRQIYVRAFALDRYENGAWSLGDAESQVISADAKGWIRFSKPIRDEILHEVFLGSDPSGMNVFTALQGARAVRLPSLTVDGEGLVMLPKSPDELGYEYLASSLPVMLADVAEADFKGHEVKSPDAGSRIGQLVLRVAGEGDLLERLKKIEDYLRKTYQYSLVTENRKNLDPIENFLFEERRGHCEFFATAGALMARELGVEVRVGYGWAGGKYFETGNMFLFRAREAHAWVEVKLEGYGWVLMEPTPPVGLGQGLPRVAEKGEEMPTPEEMIEEETAALEDSSDHLAGWAFGLTGGFGMGAVLLFVLRGRTQEDSRGGSDSARGKRKEAGYFAAWRRALGKRGVRNHAGLTIRRQVESMEDAPDFSEELIRYHYSVRYEGHPADPKRERGIEKKIEKWEGS
ncbi:MAG: transglutaminase-like domain-containing protein [Verrucomicrobiota bacterium]